MLYLVHPFPPRGNSPQGETRDMKRKTGESYASCTTQAFPLWWLAPPPFHLFKGAQQPVLTVEPLMKRVFRGVLFCPLHRGKSGAARIGGGEHSEPVSRMIIIPYDIESQSRNADFISIAHRAIHHPRPEGPLPPERSEHNPPPTGGHNLRPEGPSTFPFTTLLYNLRRSRGPFL